MDNQVVCINKEGFGDNLKASILRSGMTQAEVAEKAGITPVALSRYVHGTRIPKTDILKELATVLNTTPNKLLGLEEMADFESEYYKLYRLVVRNADKMTGRQKADIVTALFEEGT